MPTYDIFAAHPMGDLPAGSERYMTLLALHAAGCMSPDPGAETDAKKELKKLLARGQPGLGDFSLLSALGLNNIASGAIDKLPKGAVLLRFDFTLAKKYVSRDDAVFFPTDNPLRRDQVLKLPMIAPATWKGSLRSAAVERLILTGGANASKDRVALTDLLGDEKALEDGESTDESVKQHKLRNFLDRNAPQTKAQFDADHPLDKHKRGRLIFFPSWFDKTALDVLNPRDPNKRVGTVPINLEVVRTGTQSSFTLLYLPFDLLGKTPEEITKAQRRDWKLTGEALAHMLLKSGFGAKKSSGCGKIAPPINSFRFECRSAPFKQIVLSKAVQLSELANAFQEAAQ